MAAPSSAVSLGGHPGLWLLLAAAFALAAVALARGVRTGRPATPEEGGEAASFGRRLASGFLLSTLLTALMAAAAVRSVHSLLRAKNALLEVAEPQLLSVDRAHLASLRQASAARAYLFTDDPTFLARARQHDKEFLTALSRYRTLDTAPESNRLVASALRNYNDYKKELELTEGLRRSGKSLGSVARRYEERVEPERYQTENLLASLVEREVAQFQLERAQSDLAAFRSMALVYGLAAALILVGLKLSYTVSGTLGRAHEREREASRVRGELKATQAAYRELQSVSYAISHNLRAPLRSIDASARRAAAAPQAALETRARLEAVRGSVSRMASMVESLLELLGVSSAPLRRETVDLGELFRSVLEERAGDAPGLTFSVAHGMRVDGDPALLRLAVEKLVENAVKFASRRPDPRIEAGVDRSGPEAAYFLRDNGAGFDMSHAARLFVPFQRLHRSDEFPGVGMGLPVVARIVERHGGRIWAEAAAGAGATFYFTLP